MANLKWDKLMILLFVVLPISLLLWCLKQCCRDEKNATRSATEQRELILPVSSPPRNQNRSASYSPYSRRPPQLGFGIDVNETTSSSGHAAPYLSNTASNGAPYPTETSYPPTLTAPYPLSNTMPQPSSTTAPYPLFSINSIPLADQPPPSYAEVMQNK